MKSLSINGSFGVIPFCSQMIADISGTTRIVYTGRYEMIHS
ncbi:MAG: hypothetical protein ABJB11_04835 [Ferruginibacter sp.]